MIYKVKHWLYLSLCLLLLCGCGGSINIELPDNKLVFSAQGESKEYYWDKSLFLIGSSYQGDDDCKYARSDIYGDGFQCDWVRVFYTIENTTKVQGLVIETLPNKSGTPREMHIKAGAYGGKIREGKLYIFQESQ